MKGEVKMKNEKKLNITKTQVQKAKEHDIWRFGNNVLYDLCENHPKHDSEEIVAAKIWILGRTYAAPIERRIIHRELDADSFYTKIVVTEIMKSEIDTCICSLRQFSEIDNASIGRILQTHKQLTDLFKHISGRKLRSLASKYLHFHLPNLFYIFDTNAVGVVNKITKEITKEYRFKDNIIEKRKIYDEEYGRFFSKAFQLAQWIRKKFETELTPRQLDRLLLEKYKASSRRITKFIKKFSVTRISTYAIRITHDAIRIIFGSNL